MPVRTKRFAPAPPLVCCPPAAAAAAAAAAVSEPVNMHKRMRTQSPIAVVGGSSSRVVAASEIEVLSSDETSIAASVAAARAAAANGFREFAVRRRAFDRRDWSYALVLSGIALKESGIALNLIADYLTSLHEFDAARTHPRLSIARDSQAGTQTLPPAAPAAAVVPSAAAGSTYSVVSVRPRESAAASDDCRVYAFSRFSLGSEFAVRFRYGAAVGVGIRHPQFGEYAVSSVGDFHTPKSLACGNANRNRIRVAGWADRCVVSISTAPIAGSCYRSVSFTANGKLVRTCRVYSHLSEWVPFVWMRHDAAKPNSVALCNA